MSFSKLSIKLSIIGLAAFTPFAAYAGTDISVKGSISPEGCSVDVPGGADLDWGNINWVSLDKTKFTTLAAKRVSIAINCPEGTATKSAIWITDADPTSAQAGENAPGRTGHADNGRIFGIGFDPITNNKIGNFVLNPVSSNVNGYINTSKFGYSGSANTHTATPDSIGNMSQWSYSVREEWSPLDEKDKPAVGNSFVWIFDVEPQLNTADKISPNTRVSWSGTAKINVRYF